MDFESARAILPSLTRDRFGELAAVTPMVEGRMGFTVDDSRVAQSDVPARFDFDPESVALGGGRSTGERVALAGETASVSFDRKALSWLPKVGDRISRGEGDDAETYQVVRPGRTGSDVIIFFLAAVD